MLFYHRGLRGRKAPLPFVACARKTVILRGQIWSAHESDVVRILTYYENYEHHRPGVSATEICHPPRRSEGFAHRSRGRRLHSSERIYPGGTRAPERARASR